jgi:uncharacterized protein
MMFKFVLPLLITLSCENSFSQAVDVHFHPIINGDDEEVSRKIEDRLENPAIESMWILSSAYGLVDQKYAVRKNDRIARLISGNKNRLIGLCGVRVLSSWAVEEMDRCLNLEGMKGLKIHPRTEGVTLDEAGVKDAMVRIINEAQRHNAPILVDAAFQDSEKALEYMKLASEYPEVTFIFAHSGTFDSSWVTARQKLRESGTEFKISNNIYFDLSNCHKASCAFDTEFIRDDVGIDHFLFGSDHPVATQQESLDALYDLDLKNDELEAILHGNYHQLPFDFVNPHLGDNNSNSGASR